MKPYDMPSLFEARTASLFFREFIELNKSRRGFSQRAVAHKLRWPVSYIPDLIKGRKKLSLTRALQFSRHFKLDPISMEKLILLSIEDLGYLQPEDAVRLKKNKDRTRMEKSQDSGLLRADYFLIYTCVQWLQHRATLPLLVELTRRQEFTEAHIKSILADLVQRKILKKQNGVFVPLTNPFFSDDFPGHDKDEELHSTFSEYFQKYLKQKIGPSIFNSAFVHLDRSRFEEIADRIVAFRNWIYEMAKMDVQKPFSSDVRLFQMDLNLTPVFSKETAQRIRGSEMK